jgi:hypothetical protein
MTETATHYAAVRTVAAALRLWRNGDMEKVNSIVAHMPVSVFVAASLTLNEGAYASLADVTGRDFDSLVEAVVAEMIGLESEDDDEPR